MMKIGIDGSRAFIKNRTGIEEYSYQVIKNLRDSLGDHEACLPARQVVLYLRKNQMVDFEIPKNWEIRVISWPGLWTQLGLSLEMLLHPVDALFVPAHTVPMIHPEKTVVTIHGLEYEFCPKAYSSWERVYMRVSIKNSCRWASKIIAVSENTKKDLINLYKVSAEKISVIYEGFFSRHSERSEESRQSTDSEINSGILRFTQDDSVKYLLFVGRIEERKNISNIIEAFEILKEKYQISHELVLAGKPGFGYEKIKQEIQKTKYSQDISELGFASDEEKFELMKNAEVFVFPTKYEGFGIPVLEAQSCGCPVVASNNSSIPEVAGSSALLVDPENPEEIAKAINELISNEDAKNAIIAKGLENVKRFSWAKCSREISELIIG